MPALRQSVRERLEARIKCLVDLASSHRKTDKSILLGAGLNEPEPVMALAAHFECIILRYVNALIAQKSMRKAVLEPERGLVERWSLVDHDLYDCEAPDPSPLFALTSGLAILTRAEQELRGPSVTWPPDVSPVDIAVALERNKDPKALRVAKALREGSFFPRDGKLGVRDDVYTATLPSEIPEIQQDRGVAELLRDALRAQAFLLEYTDGRRAPSGARLVPELHEALKQWPILTCALVVAAEKAVRNDASRRFIPVPATKPARAAMTVISQGKIGPWHDAIKRGTAVELVWKGSPRPCQLALKLGHDFDADLVKGILDELREDGLRDWLVLHRMAAEQGRSGSFVWRWREHRERTAYDRRIGHDNLSDTEAAEAVTRRLWQLKGAEVRQNVTKPDGQTAWVRIGPFGLIDIPAGVSRGQSLELARITINPELYAGAHRDAEQPHFALLPDEALTLDGPKLRLAALIALGMRHARDHGGTLTRTARSLWVDLHVYQGTPARYLWPKADAALQRALERLVEVRVLSEWERDPGEPGPEVRFHLHPTQAWRDQLIHQISPELPPSRADLPRTGAELKEWRKRHALSQAALAAKLGLNEKTIRRAEATSAKPLGPSITDALSNLRLDGSTPALATPNEDITGHPSGS